MAKKLLLFDFDGTIADTLTVSIKILEERGDLGTRKLTAQDIAKYKGMTIPQLIAEFRYPVYKVPFLLGAVRRELTNRMQEVPLVHGMPQCLKKLQSLDFQLGIVTSNSAENVAKFLKMHKIEHFDFIQSNLNIFGKSRSLRSVMNRPAHAGKKIIYIGDEVRDITACHEVGLPVVAVTWGFNNRRVLSEHKPEILVDTPEELVQAVVKL